MSHETRHNLSSLSLVETRDCYVHTEQLCTKVDSLLESCSRLRYTENEGAKWSDIVDDYSSLSTAFQLLRDTLSISANQLAVIPQDVPEDVHMTSLIPDILAIAPSNETYTNVKKIEESLHLEKLNLETKRLFSAQDPRQLRLEIQKFNSEIDNARDHLLHFASEACGQLEKVSKLQTTLQPESLNALKEYKAQESLYDILTRLYRGTSLCPPPLRPR